MAKFEVNNVSVSTLLSFVKDGTIAIPEIQRPFVWKRSKVRDLIDSMYNGYPTGYIIRWQSPIEWIKNGGENWICDDELGGEFTLLSPVCDLGFRKGVVDTLLEIGMDKDVIEEGLEKFSDIWRDRFISSAFFNKYNCIFFLADPNVPVPEIDKEHESAWIRYRKYEYYRAHKKSVDKYGTPDDDMLMNPDEAIRLKYYLDMKDKERKQQIEDYKKEAYGKGRTHSLWG